MLSRLHTDMLAGQNDFPMRHPVVLRRRSLTTPFFNKQVSISIAKRHWAVGITQQLAINSKPLRTPQRSSAPHLSPCFCSYCCICGVTQRVHSDGQSTLCCQHSADLAFELWLTLADKACVVDESVFGCLVLGLESPAGGNRCNKAFKFNVL